MPFGALNGALGFFFVYCSNHDRLDLASPQSPLNGSPFLPKGVISVFICWLATQPLSPHVAYATGQTHAPPSPTVCVPACLSLVLFCMNLSFHHPAPDSNSLGCPVLLWKCHPCGFSTRQSPAEYQTVPVLHAMGTLQESFFLSCGPSYFLSQANHALTGGSCSLREAVGYEQSEHPAFSGAQCSPMAPFNSSHRNASNAS